MPAPVALTFPGQGSQRPGMGVEFTDTASRRIVAVAAEVTGLDVAHLLFEADADELVGPLPAQVATFVAELLALHRLHRVAGDLRPVAVAGHSLGEYGALVAAGALGVTDGLGLVAARGRAMERAARTAPGGMLAVGGLAPDRVAEICAGLPACWPANDNGPGQIVVSGATGGSPDDGLAAAEVALRAGGARTVRRLPVGGAYHSPLMSSAVDELADAIARVRFGEPRVPVVTNVDATAHGRAVDLPGLLRRQLTGAVRWAETLETLAELGAGAVLEVGPGRVLTGIARRVVPDLDAHECGSPAQIDAVCAQHGPAARRAA